MILVAMGIAGFMYWDSRKPKIEGKDKAVMPEQDKKKPGAVTSERSSKSETTKRISSMVNSASTKK